MNLSTDSVLFLFLFILPGALSKILLHEFAPKKSNEDGGMTSIMEMAKVIAFSSIVFAINILIIKCMQKNQNGFDVITSLQNYEFLIKYIGLTLLVTTVCTFLLHFVLNPCSHKIVNSYNGIARKASELKYPTLWENFFESDQVIDVANESPVVSVEKNGIVISRGILKYYPAPQTKCNELGLIYCSDIEIYFQRDEECTKDEYKIFEKTILEYYNMEYDVLIKFYDMQKYLELQNNSTSTLEEERGQSL